MNKILWCHQTINPFVGCTRVSAGCDNCYAAKFAHRGVAEQHRGLTAMTGRGPHWNGTVRFVPSALDQIAKLAKARTAKRIFVGSMTDLGHEAIDERDLFAVFAEMRRVNEWRKNEAVPPHQFLILTKRPERLGPLWNKFVAIGTNLIFHGIRFGVSVENQKTANDRVNEALKRWPYFFVSAEPLLGPIDLMMKPNGVVPGYVQPVTWVIAGGESGPGARPMHPDWARSLRDQCQAASVPFFFKQNGSWIATGHGTNCQVKNEATADIDGLKFYRVGKARAGRLLDGRTHDEFPEMP